MKGTTRPAPSSEVATAFTASPSWLQSSSVSGGTSQTAGALLPGLVPWFLWLLPSGCHLVPRLWQPYACTPGIHKTLAIEEMVLAKMPPRGTMLRADGVLTLVTATQGTPPECHPRGLMSWVSQECIYLHTFKRCCLSIGLPNSLYAGAEILPLKTVTGLGGSLMNSRHQKYKGFLGEAHRFER